MAQIDLKTNSVLFWLAALIAVGIIFIGARFLVSPLPAAAAFGVPVEGTQTLAYLWAKGTRDIVSGLLVIALLWLRVGSPGPSRFYRRRGIDPVRRLCKRICQRWREQSDGSCNPWRHSCVHMDLSRVLVVGVTMTIFGWFEQTGRRL